MLFLMKLLLRFCLDFLLPKFWITQARNLEITIKIMATLYLLILFLCADKKGGGSHGVISTQKQEIWLVELKYA